VGWRRVSQAGARPRSTNRPAGQTCRSTPAGSVAGRGVRRSGAGGGPGVKMLTVIHLYPPHHLGGYEVACQSVMERFAERGIEVEVLTAEHHMDGVDEVASPVRVRRKLRGWGDWDAWAPATLNLRERVAIE